MSAPTPDSWDALRVDLAELEAEFLGMPATHRTEMFVRVRVEILRHRMARLIGCPVHLIDADVTMNAPAGTLDVFLRYEAQLFH